MKEPKDIISLRSKNAAILFKMCTGMRGKRTLFDAACYKIALLIGMAREGHIYAYLWFLNIKKDLSETLDAFDAAVEKYEKVIEKRGGNPKTVNLPILRKVDYSFKSMVFFALGEALKKYDRLNCLLFFAKTLNVFRKNYAFFKIKDRYRKHFCQVLGKIVNIRTRGIKLVRIDDYLNNTELYQNTAQQLGAIDSQTLYNALNLADIDFLPIDIQLEEILEALRKRILEEYRGNL